MCDQDAVQAFETRSGLQNLALGPFSTVDQEAVVFMFHDLGRQTPMDGRRRGRSTEEQDFEQI